MDLNSSYISDILKKNYLGCIVINVKNYLKIFHQIDYKTGNKLELIEIEGYIKLSKAKKFKDDILTLILKEIKEIKSDVKELKHEMVEVKEDVSILKKDVAMIKKCPTIAKELAQLENPDK